MIESIIEAKVLSYYALSPKGEYYANGGQGAITKDFREALLFDSKKGAIAYREVYDKQHRITRSLLLSVQIMIGDAE
jgi:hypothetical protein